MPRRNNRLVFDTSLPSDLIVQKQDRYCDIMSFISEDDAWDYIWANEKPPTSIYEDEDYAFECTWCGNWHIGGYNPIFDDKD